MAALKMEPYISPSSGANTLCSPGSAFQISTGVQTFAFHGVPDSTRLLWLALGSLVVLLALVAALLRSGRGDYRQVRRLLFARHCDLDQTLGCEQKVVGWATETTGTLNGAIFESSFRESKITSPWQSDKYGFLTIGTAIMLLFCCYFLSLLGYFPTVFSLGDTSENFRRQYQLTNPTGPLDVFQVYHPVAFKPESNGCNQELLLMEHVFAFSYGMPFIGGQRKF